MELKVWCVNASCAVGIVMKYMCLSMCIQGGPVSQWLKTLGSMLIVLVEQTIRPQKPFAHALLGEVNLRGCGSFSARLESTRLLDLLT